MATVHYAAVLAILVLQSYSATARIDIPFLTPFFGGNACEESVCGQGNCVVSNSSTFGFECQCENGWRQARADDADDLNFLPCIVPNCTLNSNCVVAPSPSASNDRANMTLFDPCYWTDCGGGTCNKTSLFTHSCVCQEGYYNLLNTTAFPCYKECALGVGCSDLGIGFPNSTTGRPNTTPSSANDSNNQTRLIPGVDSNNQSRLIPGAEGVWLITLMTVLALVMRKDT